jgi:hypothetical protein
VDNPEYVQRWRRLFLDEVDLDAAYESLHGARGSYSEALRGRVRSLQLRSAEAWAHFDRAAELARKEKPTRRRLAERVFTATIRIEHALSENALSDQEREWVRDQGQFDDILGPPGGGILDEADCVEDPLSRRVRNLRLQTEGMLALHAGLHERAVESYRRLAEAQRGVLNTPMALAFVGTGAARHNLGADDEARRSFEDAAWTIQAGDVPLLMQIRVALLLQGAFSVLGSQSEADDWRQFVRAQPIPAKSLEIFERHEKRIIDRCLEAKAILVL